MSKRGIKVLAIVLVIIAGAALYLMTLGRSFLPHRGPVSYKTERLEFWCYASQTVLPSTPQTAYGSLQKLAWQIKHPGHARLRATVERLQAADPKKELTLQDVLEAMGYDFPPGCWATSGDNDPGWRMTHYPSVLRRIQRDFQLKVIWKERVGQQQLSSPNPQEETNASQPNVP